MIELAQRKNSITTKVTKSTKEDFFAQSRKGRKGSKKVEALKS
jgi:hypothetical protein